MEYYIPYVLPEREVNSNHPPHPQTDLVFKVFHLTGTSGSFAVYK